MTNKSIISSLSIKNLNPFNHGLQNFCNLDMEIRQLFRFCYQSLQRCLSTQSTIFEVAFWENNKWLKTIKYFRKIASSQMFNSVLNTFCFETSQFLQKIIAIKLQEKNVNFNFNDKKLSFALIETVKKSVYWFAHKLFYWFPYDRVFLR